MKAKSERRAPGLWAAVLAASASLMAMSCSTVFLPYPLVRESAAAPSAAVGVWRDPAAAFEARVDKEGHAKLAWVVWKKEQERFDLVATEAFLTPRAGPGMEERGFISVRQLDKDGKRLDRYALLEYAISGERMSIWLPRITEFEKAVEVGQLQGEVYDGGKGDNSVLVTSPKDKVFEFLEHPAHTLTGGRYDEGPGGTLFGYTHPYLLERAKSADSGGRDDFSPATIAMCGGDLPAKGLLPRTQVDGLAVKWIGMYAVDQETTRPAPHAPAGVTMVPMTKPRPVASGTRIPAKIGINFGIGFSPLGTPAGGSADFEIVWRFPQPGLADPARATPWFEHYESTVSAVGAETGAGWALRYDWELVPGVWTVEIWRGSRRLLVQSFELVRPDEFGKAPDANAPAK